MDSPNDLLSATRANGKHPGRKPWKPLDLQAIENYAARGLNFRQIAALLHIRPETLTRKRHQFEQLNQAIARGRATGVAAMANRLYEAGLAGDTRAAEFFLRSIGGWRDKTEIDLNVSGEVSVNPAREERLNLARHMTRSERQVIREIETRARERIAAAAKPANLPAIETSAKLV